MDLDSTVESALGVPHIKSAPATSQTNKAGFLDSSRDLSRVMKRIFISSHLILWLVSLVSMWHENFCMTTKQVRAKQLYPTMLSSLLLIKLHTVSSKPLKC
jgi:hypothetical protein